MSPRRYTTPKPQDFDPRKVSPSRINSLAQCGVAFEMKYVKGMPEVRSGSAALFGTVMHNALERWAMNRSASLLTLVRSAWLTETEGTVVNDFLGAYAALSGEAIRLEYKIRQDWLAKGKESKAPRMTKDFKTSPVAGKIARLEGQYAARLADCPWRFRENDPITGLYDESLVLAKRYEAKWAKLPNALYTELAFDVKFEGFLLNGYIDCIEQLGDEAILVTDYKTYAKAPPAAKDQRQFTIYDVAIREMIRRGEVVLPDLPIFVCMDYVRLLERKVEAVTTGAYDLLKRDLLNYAAIVDAGAYLPAEKNRNPDFCGMGEDCCLLKNLNREVEVTWPT